MRYVILLFIYCFSLQGSAQTTRINFTTPEFYPEGVAYNHKSDVFFVGSVKTGSIIIVDKLGNAKVFYEDSSLKSSFGMKVDSPRNCLWVCTGDPNYSIYSDSTTYKKKIRIVGIDLTSGKKIRDHDLSYLKAGKHFANDLTLDDSGSIYITDSYSPDIYRIDPSGIAGIWSENDLYKGLDIGLNGIVWHPAGYFLAVNNGNGAILKIKRDSPKDAKVVKIGTFFPGADGLLIDPSGDLVLVQNKGVNKVFLISSTDNFESATIKAATASEDRFQQPSTCVMAGGKVYVVNSKLNELQDPGQSPSKEFSLQVAVFRPLK